MCTKTIGRPKEDEMEQVNTNPMIWALFVNAFLKAAVHLGKDCAENLRVTKNTKFSKIRLSFSLTGIDL